ncbi:hypothetical protein BSK59_13225 [Paenibacillus odorifer]|nr:hypothetical protein BSK59_13225 [Paenibacillus odorifer]
MSYKIQPLPPVQERLKPLKQPLLKNQKNSMDNTFQSILNNLMRPQSKQVNMYRTGRFLEGELYIKTLLGEYILLKDAIKYE